MVTQCPACGTRFRITGSQLDRADGKVRCGACLEIFLARDSLSAEDETPGAAAGVGETNESAVHESVSENAVQRQPGKRGANARKAAGKGRSEAAAVQAARDDPGRGWWVRWALLVAVLILILQVVLYLV